MRFYQQFRVFAVRSTVVAGTALMFVCGPALSAFGQPPQTVSTPQPPTTTTPATQAPSNTALPQVVSPVDNGTPLSIEDAVKMALENNLGIKAERMNPEIAAYALEQVQGAYAPSLLSSFSQGSAATPPNDFLSTGVSVVTNGNLQTGVGLQQNVRFGGGSYQVTWNGSRGTTDQPRPVFSPSLGSNMTALYNQPLLRNFRIDATRQQLQEARNNATIADLQVRQRITQTSFAVRAAYYNLVGAIESYKVAQESLNISKKSLADNQRRLAVGTIPQIDIVSSEAEVASNEEAVVVGLGAIDTAEDTLRALVMNSSQTGFWNVTFKPTDPEQMTPANIDVDAAVKNALDNRTDLLIFQKQMDNTNVAMKFAADQKLPAANLQATYGVRGFGGTQFSYDPLDLSAQPTATVRTFSDVLRDVLGNNFRTWSVAVNFSYPLGTSQASAAYAEAKIQSQQQKTSLQDQQTQVATAVRQAARQVNTNLKRVEVDRRARELAQQKLDAEQKRFDVGLSTTFELFQAQRDLDSALRTEVSATIAYSQSLAAFEAIQMAPLNGGS